MGESASQTVQTDEQAVRPETEMGNPLIFALYVLGQATLVLGIWPFYREALQGALLFALFSVTVSYVLAAVLQIRKGESWLAGTFATLGIPLFGLFLYQLLGPSLGLVTPESIALIFGMTVIPCGLLGLKAIKLGDYMNIALFYLLTAVLLFSALDVLGFPFARYLLSATSLGTTVLAWYMATGLVLEEEPAV